MPRIMAAAPHMEPTPRNIRSPPMVCDNPCEPKQDVPMIPLTSSELLNLSYRTKVKRCRDKIPCSVYCCNDDASSPAATTIMNVAKEQLLQCSFMSPELINNVASRFGPLSGFSCKDLEMAMLIQAAAEEVADGKYIRARKLLMRCDRLSCKEGNPVERVVFYFSQALQAKIDGEWGLGSSYREEGEEIKEDIDVEQAHYYLQPVTMKSQQEEPFRLVTHFTVSQTILDNVVSAKKVHLIDFGIENGSHWIPLMQSLAATRGSTHEFPFELLKITAVGSKKEMMEVTGRWLSSYAATIDLPFSFEIVISDLKHMKVDMFHELESDESVAVYLGLRLWTLLVRPNDLHSLINVIRDINPCILVVREMEGRTNSPNFLERFQNALALYTAMFDCINSSMNHRILFRKLTEETISARILNVITSEDRERVYRYEDIDFWRALFHRFGMVETELSSASLSDARWLHQNCSRFSYCSLEMDGKSLIMGWMGTQLTSLSAWKFLPERNFF